MFDPNLPTPNTLADANAMRAQLNGLNDKIDAMSGVTSAVVDSVTTVDPGEPATVTISVIGTILHLSLALPQGQPGPPGLQGPPFANVVIDSITTLDPGENASVTVFFDGALVHLGFGIPRGMQGEPGPAGQVTIEGLNGAIATAIAETARNPSGIAPFGGSFSDPPTQTEMLAFAAWSETLRAALVR